MATPMKVEPRGLPTPRRRLDSVGEVVVARSRRVWAWVGGRIAGGVCWECRVLCESVDAVAVLRRKSWVTAMPIEAKAREVRIQARKVRSVGWLVVGLYIVCSDDLPSAR